jgi:hypothetical protein
MKTYCNPLPLPDYPRGVLCRPERKERPDFAKLPPLARRDWREMADPTVIYDEAKSRWILYPSGHMAYVSTDLVKWRHHPIEPAATGYAPTVAKIAGRWWLTACHSPMFIADDPLGPFEVAGPVTLPNGSPPPREQGWGDPMLFADDDGRA